MNRVNIARLIVAGLSVVALGGCVILPTISETPLMDDIHKNQLSVSAGTEIVLNETPGILPDIVYEYISYAPTDWFEIGLGGHYGIVLVGADFKLDIVDMFTDNSPFSAMLVGGALTSPNAGGFVGHAGAVVNYRVTDFLELYAGATTSTLLFIPIAQVGASVAPFDWLSLSANLKIAVDTLLDPSSDVSPFVFMLSIAPSFNFDLGGK